MAANISARYSIVKVFGVAFLVMALSGAFHLTFAAAPEPTASAPGPAASAAPTSKQSAAVIKAQDAWRQSIIRKQQPGPGCFKASYPNTTWQVVPCGTAPPEPQGPRLGRVRPSIVGNGSDFAATVTGTISSMTGSFDNVQGVRTITATGKSKSDFSLQLNTNTFTSAACQTASNPSACTGWEQFVYSNAGSLYIQYWRLAYNKDCPDHWTKSSGGCYFNSPAVSVPVQSVGDLAKLSLTGTAAAGGNDTITLATSPTQVYTISYYDNVLGLAAKWNGAEYNIVGDCCTTQSNFNLGSLITVRATVNAGSGSLAPSCVTTGFQGFTGETNNLNLAANCGSPGGTSITFTQANTPLITSVSPTTGSAAGGTPVTLSGSGFTGATSVTFSNGFTFPATPATYTVNSDSTIIAVSPPCGPQGCSDSTFGELITVTTPIGSGTGLVGFQPYAVVAGVSPTSGVAGTKVTVTGNGFYNSGPNPAFSFGGVAALDVDCSTSRNTQCTMVAPEASAGTVDVTLGASPANPQDKFTFIGPAITSISPNTGSEDGGTRVVLTGRGFSQNMEAAFGTNYIGVQGDCPSSTQCVASAPRGNGTVHVTIGNGDGTDFSEPTSADLFTYQAYPWGIMQPHTGLPGGGTAVTVSGHNLSTAPGGTVITFNFSGGSTPALNVSCSAAPPTSLAEFQETCTMTVPPLNPAGTGPIVVPVTATVDGKTSSIGGFTYAVPTPPVPPPGKLCQQCREAGGTCSTVNGKFVCKGTLQ